MSIIEQLNKRAGSKCELCQNNDNLQAYQVPPVSKDGIDGQCLVCYTCLEQIEDPEKVDINHWRCLNDTIWSQYPAVQVMAWRMLTRISAEGWPLDLLGQMYMEEENLAWAKATGEGLEDPVGPVHRDVNGVILEAGDSVVLIKDLKVKGSSMVAKQGTAVRRIFLDHNNEEYIEGRVDGQQIVIITKYVKKI